MNSKKKSMSILVVTMAVLLFVIAVVSVVAIWAAKRQTFSSNINVKYTAQSVKGSASARWKVGSEDWQPMTSSSGEETVTFDSEANENATLSPEDIVLTEQNPFVVFEYQFTNTGSKPYTVDMFWQNGFQENISVYTVNTTTAIADDMLKDEIDTGFADFFSTTVEGNNGTTYLYILAEITIPGIDSAYTGSFQFDLDGKNHAADYVFDNGTITGLKDGVSTTTLHIPSEIDGTPVTTIAAGSFVDLTEVTLVAIPDSVETIEQGAFQFTDAQLKPKLKYLQIPFIRGDSLDNYDSYCASYMFGGLDYTYNERKQYFPTSIRSVVITKEWAPSHAFDGCQNITRVSLPGDTDVAIQPATFRRCTQLDHFVMPKNTEFVANNAFYACSNLTSISIPSGGIEDNAFYNCKALKYVRILHYDDGYYVCENAFNGCNNLSAIYFDDTLQRWCEDDMTFDTNGNKATQLLTTATNAVPRKLYVMENGEYHRVSGSVTIPQGTTKINAMAFCGLSDISEIVIPDSVTDIGRQAFNKCEGLRRVRYNGTLDQWIQNSLTYSNSITGQTYLLDKDHPRQLYIKGRLLTNAEIDAGNAAISQYAFSNLPDLTSVTISDGITDIGGRAFQNCTGLTTVSIPGSVATIGASAFQGCTNLANLTLNNGITEIAGSAFRECGITGTLTIPDSVTTIAAAAFQDCTKMENVKLSNQLGTIEQALFYGCSGLVGPLTFPESVTAIRNDAFRACSSLSGTLTIPENVNYIGTFAFQDCSSLTDLVILSSNIGIESYNGSPFLYCTGLNSIRIDADNYTSKNSAGEECNVIVEKYSNTLITGCNKSTIPDNVGTIGVKSFCGCLGLTSIVIPTSVTSIGEQAFYNCTNLKKVTNNSGLLIEVGKETNGYVAYYADEVIEKDWPMLDFVLVDDYYEVKAKSTTETIGEIEIPAIHSGKRVTTIAADGFKDCTGMTGITIPSGITTIGNQAFYNCTGLTQINYNAYSVSDLTESSNVFYNAGSSISGITAIVGNNVRKVPAYLFSVSDSDSANCANITSLTIGSNVYNIGKRAFANLYNLKNIDYNAINAADLASASASYVFYKAGENVADMTMTIGNNVTRVPDYLCYGNSTTYPNISQLTIGSSVNIIGDYAFYGCQKLTNFDIPKSVTNIGDWAFYDCSGLTRIDFSEGLISIGSSAFYDCSGLTRVDFSEGLISIGNIAFCGCSGLTIINFSEGLISIGNRAFEDCSSLTAIAIPATVSNLGDRVFQNCNNLESIVVNSNNQKYTSRDNTGKECNVIVDTTTHTLIQGCNNSTIPDDIISIGDCAFYYCRKLTNVDIPKSVTNIGSNAFYHCENLVTNIQEGVISIGNSAFYACNELENIVIPASVTNIGNFVFGYCRSIESIVVNSNNQKYTSRDNTGKECNVIVDTTTHTLIQGCKTSTIPDDGSVTSLASGSFQWCPGLTSIVIPETITCITDGTFNTCSDLKKVVISKNVSKIEGLAFGGCQRLNEVIIDSADIYNAISSDLKSNGCLTRYIKTGGTIKIWDNIDDNSNTYLSDGVTYTKSTEKEQIGDKFYWVYTKN